ncbi:MAG: hypothetical protein V7631_1707 [Massilia sp.]
MLDALLAIFGTLAVLLSIAAKFFTSSADTGADEDAGRDQLRDSVVPLHISQSDRVHRRDCTRVQEQAAKVSLVGKPHH